MKTLHSPAARRAPPIDPGMPAFFASHWVGYRISGNFVLAALCHDELSDPNSAAHADLVDIVRRLAREPRPAHPV